MKIGVIVPLLTETPEPALRAARAAEEAGIDGVFAFDHLWNPVASTQTPDTRHWSQSCFPVLSACGAVTERISVGTLVARIGSVAYSTVMRELMTMHTIFGSRLIAGIGVGDRASHLENVAMGVEPPDFAQRMNHLRVAGSSLRSLGVEVWFGGRSTSVRNAADEVGVRVNQWDVSPSDLQSGDTWAGPFVDALHVVALREAGAHWAVFIGPEMASRPERFVEEVAAAL